MPPRKRKAAATSKKDKEQPSESEDAGASTIDDKVAQLVREKLQAVDKAGGCYQLVPERNAMSTSRLF